MAYKQSQEVDAPIFILRGLNKEVKVQETIVNFTPIGTLLQKQHAYSKIAIPTFNNDRHYFTPAFLLPPDQNFYKLNETFERCQFDQQIKRNLQSLKQNQTSLTQSNIKLSSPNVDYCLICRQKYSNYFDHISESTHLQLVENNHFNKSIQQMCFLFNNKAKSKISKLNKHKNNKNKINKLPSYEKPTTRLAKMRNIESNRGQSFSTLAESS